MVSRSLSYALRLTGETDPSLPRAFGSVSREIDDTNRRIVEARAQQERLTRELRGVRRGTEEYDRLQGEVERARGEMSRLTGVLNAQQESWTTLNRRSTQFRNATLAGLGVLGAGVGGLILQVDRLGESSAQLLSIANSTGLAVEEVQRLQRVVGLSGFDLDIGDFTELSIRLGEIRQEAEDTNAAKALDALGLTARTVATRDLPEIVRKLQEVEDVQRRAFLADEILGGPLAERLIPALDIPQEQLDRLERVPVLSREQAEQFRDARVELQAFKAQFAQTGATVGSAFLPQLTSALEAVEPLVAGFSEFARENPQVLTAIAAIGAATVTLTGIIWAAVAARATLAALTPGVGWAALAAAAVIGGGVAGLGAAAVSRGRAALAEGATEQRTLTSGIRDAAEMGTRAGSMAAAEELKDFNSRTLENILPRIDCVEERLEDRPERPAPAPDAAPAPFTTPFTAPTLPDDIATSGGFLSQFRGANRGTYDSSRTIRDYTNPSPVRFGDPGFELPDDLRALLSTDPAERAQAVTAFTRVGEPALPGADVSPAAEAAAALTEAAEAFARTGELPLDLFAVGGALRRLPGSTYDQRTIMGDEFSTTVDGRTIQGDEFSTTVDGRTIQGDEFSTTVDGRTIQGDEFSTVNRQVSEGDDILGDFFDNRTSDRRSFDQQSVAGDRNVTVYQTNHIATSEAAEEALAELEDALRFASLGR